MKVHEILEVVADVLLNRVAHAQVRGDLRIDLVPGAADLRLEIAAQWSEVLVQNLEAPRSRTWRRSPMDLGWISSGTLRPLRAASSRMRARVKMTLAMSLAVTIGATRNAPIVPKALPWRCR